VPGLSGVPMTFSITADLIAAFATLTGDEHPIHTDEEFARSTPFGRTIAHGLLVLGLMSTQMNTLSELIEERTGAVTISLGYDRVRFVAPVFAGDRVTTTSRVGDIQTKELRILCEERCARESGELLATAVHILKLT